MHPKPKHFIILYYSNSQGAGESPVSWGTALTTNFHFVFPEPAIGGPGRGEKDADNYSHFAK